MNKQFGRLITISALTIVTLIGILFTCWRIFPRLDPEYWYEHKVSSTESFYKINPATILSLLAQGQKDVFIQKTATPEGVVTLEEGLIDWSQSDYLKIAQVLHEFVWKEPVKDWELHQMRFNVDCENTGQGFQFGGFQYFKIDYQQEQETRFVHDITISPLYNSVNSYQYQLSPIRESWHSIDFSLLKVSAGEALSIAERNGGYNARFAVENMCTIYLILAPGSLIDGWQVGYSGEDAKSIFEIEIDPYTGDYKTVYSKTR